MNASVVIDTNVLVSAGIKWDTNPAMVVDGVLNGAVPYMVCPAVVDEYEEVLGRSKFKRHGFPPVWFSSLMLRAFRQPNPPIWPLDGPDPTDLVFLSLAYQTNSVLVTGNTDDYPEAIRMGVRVVTPREWVADWRA